MCLINVNSYNTVRWYRNIFSQVPSTKVREAMVQCVYVVTSTGRDIYSAMTRVSVSSLRLSNPNLGMTLVLDKPSSEALKAQADPLLDEVDQVLAFNTPEGPAIYRNRFIKTSLRERIEGPYLFLDSDMLIRGHLSDVFSIDADVACAPNHSKDRVEEQMCDEDRTALARMGWQTRPDVYVNGGLMLFNGTPGARRFAAAWHDGWLASYARGMATSPP
jgi:hypothetical protein